MTQHITQEQAVALSTKAGDEFAIHEAEFYTSLCNAAIQHYLDQRKAELPVLPELDQEDQQWLTDNPNTSDIVAFIRRYATGHGQQCAAQARKVALEPVLVVEKEPDYWSGGHFHEGSKPHIKPTKVWCLPIGTQLFTRPMPAQDVKELVEALKACLQCFDEMKGRKPSFVEDSIAMSKEALANAKGAK